MTTQQTPKGAKPNNNTVVLRSLNPLRFIGLNRNAFRLFARLAVLTKDGEQSCLYTNRQAAKELKITERTATNAFKLLVSKGYVTLDFVSGPVAACSNIRCVSLTDFSVDLLKGPNSAVYQHDDSAKEGSDDAKTAKNGLNTGAAEGVENPHENGVENPKTSHRIFGPLSPDSAQLAQDQHPSKSAPETGLNTRLSAHPRREMHEHRVESTDYYYGSEVSRLVLATRTLSCAGPWAFSAQGLEDPLVMPAVEGAQVYVRPHVDSRGYAASGRVGTVRFDFTEPLKQMGLAVTRVNGEPYSARFDFGPLQEQLLPCKEHPHKGVCAIRDEVGLEQLPHAVDVEWLHRYFVFAVLDEICNYEFFSTCRAFQIPSICNRKEIAHYFACNQYSLLFPVISAKWGTDIDYFVDPEEGRVQVEYASEYFVNHVLERYKPHKDTSPLRYLSACVAREALDVLASSEYYPRAAEIFLQAVSNKWCHASWQSNRLSMNCKSLLDNYYPQSDISAQLMLWAQTDMPFFARLSYPYLLMRKVCGINELASYGMSLVEDADKIARQYLHLLGTDQICKEQWQNFVSHYQHAYPFLTQLDFDHV